MSDSLKKYRKHPRIVELRIALIYHRLLKEFGIEATDKLVKHICDVADIDEKVLFRVIAHENTILTNVHYEKRFRQEVIFMGYCYGESRRETVRKYLPVKIGTIYNEGEVYDVEKFATKHWLERLDSEFQVLGIKSYLFASIHFLTFLERLVDLL